MIKVITAKSNDEARHFLETITPPIVAVVKRPGIQLDKPVGVSVFNLPPQKELYQVILNSIFTV